MSKNMTDWKLGSGDQVDTIFTKALEGLKMKALSRIPPALPGGYVYSGWCDTPSTGKTS